MSDSLRFALDAIFVALDVPPPPGPHGERVEFGVEDVDMVLELAPDGRTTLLTGFLGYLSAEPLSAGAQLHRLLRGGLALSGDNRAALTLPEAQTLDDIVALGGAADTEGRALRLAAIARVAAGDRQDAIRALGDILHWRRLARETLGDAPDNSGPERDRRPGPIDPSDFVIIQP
jgi:hypothetical protein